MSHDLFIPDPEVLAKATRRRNSSDDEARISDLNAAASLIECLSDLDNRPESNDLIEEIIESLDAGFNRFREVLTGLRKAS